MIAIKGNSK